MKGTDWVDLGRRLRQAREEIGLSQNEAATLIGTKAPTLNRYEGGDRTVSIGVLIDLGRIYGKPVSWFLAAVEDAYERERLAQIDPLLLDRATSITPGQQRVIARALSGLQRFVEEYQAAGRVL